MIAPQYVLALVMFFALGAVFGSFFNVLIYRLPAGESVVSPPSHCPKCNHQITWYENIPIFSWIFLRAKCSSCGTHISIQYPTIELITALFSVALFHFIMVPQLQDLLYAPWYRYLPLGLQYLTALLFIPIALIDIRHLIIPDSLTISGSILAIALAFIPGGITPQMALAGILIGGGTLFLLGVVGKLVLKKDAMGMGDVKMLIWFGALFGPGITFGTILLGAVFGLIGSIILMILGKMDKEQYIPFGPYLCLGTTVAIFWGEPLWAWYTSITSSL